MNFTIITLLNCLIFENILATKRYLKILDNKSNSSLNSLKKYSILVLKLQNTIMKNDSNMHCKFLFHKKYKQHLSVLYFIFKTILLKRAYINYAKNNDKKCKNSKTFNKD